MPPTSGPDLEALAAQSAWVRELALRVARDAAEADELAQEALVAALRRRPEERESLRSWFADVLQKLALFRRRGDARRAQREARVARPETLSVDATDPHLALERLETQERLLRAVRELDEPYRTTILLRWFEGLEPRAIAERTGANVRTVHTRLARGHELLRARLDAHAGGRERWMSAWMPLLFVPAPAAPPPFAWTGPWILAMDLKLKCALAGVVLVGAIALWKLLPADSTAPLAGAPSAPPTTAAIDAPPPNLDVERGAATPRQAAEPALVATTVASPVAPSPRVRGEVLDVEGRPVALLLRFVPEDGAKLELDVESDAAGRFEFDAPVLEGTLAPRDPAWTAVLEPRITAPPGDALYRLVIAPRIELAGRVVDARGTPVEDADVGFSAADVRNALGVVLTTSALREWRTRTDADGRFALPEVPAIARSKVLASAPGYAAARVDAPLATNRALELVLGPGDASAHVSGRVVDARHAPVEGAHVVIDRLAVTTDRLGRFELTAGPRDERTGEGGGTELRVAKRGFLPVALRSAKPTATEPGAWPDPLVIVLGAPALTLQGAVVDERGEPVAGARVTPLDRSPFGDVLTAFGAERFALAMDLEAVLSGATDRRGSTTTAADGGFELSGLLAHDYRLRVFDPRTLEVLVTEPFSAGRRGLRIVLAKSEHRARVAGVVVDRRGRPYANAEVLLACAHPALDEDDARDLVSAPRKTDAEGRFEFTDVSDSATRVSAWLVDGATRASVELAGAIAIDRLRIELPRPCHVRVESDREDLVGAAYGFLDERGQRLEFSLELGDVTPSATLFGWNGTKSGILTVPEDARTLVFLVHESTGTKEVARLPVEFPLDGAVVVLRP